MTYNRDKSKKELEAERAAHPVWRGIGFLFMILVPILAFGISEALLKYLKINTPGFVIPPQLSGAQKVLPGYFVEDFWVVVMMSLVISLLVYALYSMIAAIIHAVSPTLKYSDLRTNVKGEKYKPKRKYKQRR